MVKGDHFVTKVGARFYFSTANITKMCSPAGFRAVLVMFCWCSLSIKKQNKKDFYKSSERSLVDSSHSIREHTLEVAWFVYHWILFWWHMLLFIVQCIVKLVFSLNLCIWKCYQNEMFILATFWCFFPVMLKRRETTWKYVMQLRYVVYYKAFMKVLLLETRFWFWCWPGLPVLLVHLQKRGPFQVEK